MRRALALSLAVLGTTSPNPPVGAVVLDARGEVVGQGATAPAGGPHAEVVALAQAGERSRGGTVVCTLEPCAHTGRTGPCADAILAAGVARVAYAVPDPTALAGGGGARLRAAGVEVVEGVLAEPVRHGPLEAWLHRQVTGRPLVTWKYAATLDGRSAAADGSSRWVTGEAARADVHLLRSQCDAVVVGVGTVLADDPELTVRPAGHALDGRQPLRVVVEGQRRTPPGARLLDGGAPTWRVRTVPGPPAEPRAGVREVAVPPGPDGLPALLRELDTAGVVSVLLEGGPTLAGAFWQAGLVDRVVGYLAPALLGAGPVALAGAGVGTISDAIRLRVDDVSRLGDDVRLTLRRPACSPESSRSSAR